jgi:asparagine synthase (glutamine-hydrolysing)
MTMAAGLEARVPLLNSDLLSFVNALPAKTKMHRGRLKGLLRASLNGDLPKSILNKPKKGFGPPTSYWLRNELAPVLDRLLSRKRITEQGYFDFNEISRLRREHEARKADHGRKLWALASFQLWHQNFIENRFPA